MKKSGGNSGNNQIMETLIPVKKYELIQDSFDDYCQKEDYINAGRLKLLKRSPLHLRDHVKKDSPEFRFGRMYHEYVLEPERFKKEYHVFDAEERPDKSKGMTANVNKIWKEDFKLRYGENIIPIDLFSVLVEMRKRLMSDFFIRSLLHKGLSEVSVYVEDYQGTKAKIRIDYLKDNAIIDLKTASDASFDAFTGSAAKFNYHISAALYHDIIASIYGKERPFIFIVQEKEVPFATNIFQASQQFLNVGKNEVDLLIEQYKKCLDSGEYRGYSIFADNKFGVRELSLPPWSIKPLIFYDKKDENE